MASRTVEDDVPELTLQASRASPQAPPSLRSDPIALTALTPDDAKVKDLAVACIPGEPEKDGDELDNYPDGGREAWLVVVGGMCAAMGAFGLVASIGAFQTWYENNLLSSWSPSQIAWIGSTQVAVCFTVCLFTGPVVDRIGPRPMLVAGTVLLVFGFCMLSLAKQYWQIFLCHAGPIALGMDLVFLGPLSAVGHWFLRRRGLAFGILMTGSSVGAIVWPLLIAHLPQRIGWGWTMRVMALALGVLGSIASILVKTRLPPKPRGPFFHLGEFRNMSYTAVAFAVPANAFGFFSFLMFIGTYGNIVGLHTLSPYLLIISNASSGFGRIIGGVAADYLGVFNIAILASFGMAVLIFSWMAMNTAAALIVLCILYGFLSGIPVAMHAPMIMAVISDERLSGTLIGQAMVVESVSSVCAAPIFGLIVGTGTPEEKFKNFKKAIAFGGSMLMLSAILLLPPRFKISRKFWTVA